MLISAVQQSDRYTYICIPLYTLFHYDLSEDTESSSLCYTVGPCYLSNQTHLLNYNDVIVRGHTDQS